MVLLVLKKIQAKAVPNLKVSILLFFPCKSIFKDFYFFFKATAIIESVENLQPRTRSSIVDISDQV